MNEAKPIRALTAAKWVRFFEAAGVMSDVLAAARGEQARAIAVGKFLSGKVGREVPITIGGRTGKATLRAAEGRSRQKSYYFEVVWDSPKQTSPAPAKKPSGAERPRSKGVGAAKKKDRKATEPHKGSAVAKHARPRPGGNDERW
jgi:hypothetical protein